MIIVRFFYLTRIALTRARLPVLLSTVRDQTRTRRNRNEFTLVDRPCD